MEDYKIMVLETTSDIEKKKKIGAGQKLRTKKHGNITNKTPRRFEARIYRK